MSAPKSVGRRPRSPRESGQAVDAADEDVLDAALLELGHDGQPELRPLRALKPNAENVALALGVDADGQVAGGVDGLAVTDLHDEGVEVEDRVDLLGRSGLPHLRVVRHGGGNAADGVAPDAGPVELADVGLDLPLTTRTRPVDSRRVQAASETGFR